MKLHQYNHLHLALLSGKGGVGKTTLSCALARFWAQKFPQEQVLLLSTDPAHSLGDVLQMTVTDTAQAIADLPNLQVRALDAPRLLQAFKDRYGPVLELLVERGSFVQQEDLTPVWDLSWPGLDELMGILEIQRLLQTGSIDRVVVDMAPSGHTLNLFGLMDFLDEFLAALALFQEKHRVIQQTFTGKTSRDQADEFLQMMNTELTNGRALLQNFEHTACFVVAIAEPMSLLETQRFIAALHPLKIPVGGLIVNQLLAETLGREAGKAELHITATIGDRIVEQQKLLGDFLNVADYIPVLVVPQQSHEPIGNQALDQLISELQLLKEAPLVQAAAPIFMPEKIAPGFGDFIAAGRSLILVGGKGGVGKTTVAAAIAWGMAAQYPERNVRVISIDPAHSLGDAFGMTLGHEAIAISPNLSGQEVDAEILLDQFRAEYLWELAAMMSGESSDGDSSLKIAYGPEAWRKIVSQALPGIDEMLALITVIELLESNSQDLIILDTAPTGHLLRFLEMPAAMTDWLSWIFKLWIKYQDVLGRTELMGRLRSLRQRVVQAQKKLKDPHHTEFIGVVQAQATITAEAHRLSTSLTQLGIAQRYIVHNRCEPGEAAAIAPFPNQTLVRLPALPRCISPLERIQIASQLLF